jgi:hypothetical protein
MEPVTYHPRTWTPIVRAAISMNLVTSVGLVTAGVRNAVKQARQRGCQL